MRRDVKLLQLMINDSRLKKTKKKNIKDKSRNIFCVLRVLFGAFIFRLRFLPVIQRNVFIPSKSARREEERERGTR